MRLLQRSVILENHFQPESQTTDQKHVTASAAPVLREGRKRDSFHRQSGVHLGIPVKCDSAAGQDSRPCIATIGNRMTDGKIDTQGTLCQREDRRSPDMKPILIISAVLLLTITVTPARSQVYFRSLTPHPATCTPSPTASKLPSCASWRSFILKVSCSTPCKYIGSKCMDCEGHACSTC
jgi:hypothetical protein